MSTLSYRFKGIELDNGTLTIDGIDPADVRIQLDDEVPPEPQPKPGKVVDKLVELELRLVKEFDRDEQGANRSVRGLEFVLSCDNPRFKIRGTDVEALRAAMWEFLDKSFEVKWTPYLLVRVEATSLYGGSRSNGLGFSYERIEKGVAHNGSLLMRQWNRHTRHGFSVEAWPGEFKDKHGKLLACIPETDANTAAMDEFIKMIDQLRKRLADHFRPDTIAQTLANLGALQMLGTDETNKRGAA